MNEISEFLVVFGKLPTVALYIGIISFFHVFYVSPNQPKNLITL